MSWDLLMQIVAKHAGEETAEKINRAIRTELCGVRITIPARLRVTAEQIEKVAPGQPRKAAKELGIHPSTAYRALRRQRIVR